MQPVLKRASIPTPIISESLSHSSEKITQIYLDSFGIPQIDEIVVADSLSHLIYCPRQNDIRASQKAIGQKVGMETKKRTTAEECPPSVMRTQIDAKRLSYYRFRPCKDSCSEEHKPR